MNVSLRRLTPFVCLGIVALAGAAGAGPGQGGARATAGAEAGPGLSPTQPSGPGAAGAASAEASQGASLFAMPPRLEVQRGSGDFTSFHDSIVVDGTTAIRLRWSPSHAATAGASWTTQSAPLGPPGGVRPRPSGKVQSAPGAGEWAFFDVDFFRLRGGIPAGATRYLLRVQALDAGGDPVGAPSQAVTIDYEPPGTGPAQTIQLDTVTLTSWSPTNGTMNGPNNDNHSSYAPNETVKTTLAVNLLTEDEAVLKHYLIGADGRSLEGSYHMNLFVSGKGSHTKNSFTTVRCDTSGNPHYEQTATGIAWSLYRKSDGGVLAEGQKNFPGGSQLVWRCPGGDQLALTGKTPASGVLRGIGSPSDASQPGRAVQLQYSYRLGSEPTAVVKQIPLLANYQPAPHQYWTDETVSNATGSVTNRLSIYCQSESQPDVQVKHLRYALAQEGNGATILQHVTPVDWTFTCKPLQIQPGAVKALRGLGGTGSETRSLRGSTGAQKVVPNPAARGIKGTPSAVAPRRVPALPSSDEAEAEAAAPKAKKGIQPIRRPR